jgi:hypothetical protein
MKHIVLCPDRWEWSTDPFPRYVLRHTRFFVPVKDVSPVVRYMARAYDGARDVVLYEGADLAAAEAAKAQFDAEEKAAGRVWRAEVRSLFPTLPDGQFRVIKTREKGTILVVPGDEPSNRALVFIGADSGFRGDVCVVPAGTTAHILMDSYSGSRLGSHIDVVAIFDIGQSISFHSWGRRNNDVLVYTWDGHEISKKVYTKEEWDVATHPQKEAEVL